MALYLLGGPFDVTAGPEQPGLFSSTPLWLDEYGLVGLFRNVDTRLGGYRTSIAQYDGVTYLRNNDYFSHPTLMYDATRNSALHFDGLRDALYEFDPLVCVIGDKVEDWEWYQYGIKLRDRYLRCVWSWSEHAYVVQSSPHGGHGKHWTTEFGPLSGSAPRGETVTSSLFKGGKVCFALSNGVIHLYDIEGRQEVGSWRTIGLANRGIWASKTLGVFISLHDKDGRGSQQEMRVWADEVEPAAISTPESLAPILQGRVATVRARVTGAQGELCPGHAVEWSIADGPGELIKAPSTSDAEGYAYTEYRPPVLDPSAVTITAKVRY
jgi:hypothetical protein